MLWPFHFPADRRKFTGGRFCELSGQIDTVLIVQDNAAHESQQYIRLSLWSWLEVSGPEAKALRRAGRPLSFFCGTNYFRNLVFSAIRPFFSGLHPTHLALILLTTCFGWT